MGCCCSTTNSCGVVLDNISSFHRVKTLDIDGVARYIRSAGCKRIVVMVGAGVSVSAGIPDFRSIQNGLYENKIKAYSTLPSPQHMFDIEYFAENQKPFYSFVGELLPKPTTLPTKTHHLLKLLSEKGLLSRVYTQNIDMLERIVGIPSQKIIECHGTMATASCAKCKRRVDAERILKKILDDKTTPKCAHCGGPVKPDITFFGEKLPRSLLEQMKLDMPDLRKADLLLVLGTSLAVQPFASFIDKVGRAVPRVFVNREGAGKKGDYDDDGGVHMYGRFGNFRDIVLKGDADKISDALAERIDWKEELHNSVRNFKTSPSRLVWAGAAGVGEKSSMEHRRSSATSVTLAGGGGSSRRMSLNGGAAAIHIK